MKDTMPAVFFGHGNPMNALARNSYTEQWAAFGKTVPKPRAVLCVSAHYYTPFSMVTANLAPPTIHDFSGFPGELYKVQYPAPGDPGLARRVRDMLAPVKVRLDEDWGLDHGTWSVLMHVFPKADIPVVQLSIDETRSAAFHFETGARLKALRQEGILIVGSGNLVHNLALYRWGDASAGPYEWALRFEERVKALLSQGDDQALVNYHQLGEDGRLAVPTPDHYLPLLYVLGLRNPGDTISFPVQGIEGGSVSMLAVKVSPNVSND
jgi:4,5-DOPA dioxygenase extradiol